MSKSPFLDERKRFHISVGSNMSEMEYVEREAARNRRSVSGQFWAIIDQNQKLVQENEMLKRTFLAV